MSISSNSGETWHRVGSSSEVEKPGQYLTTDISGEPIVVVRGNDNKLRALSRVCRHRGFDLLEGALSPDGDLHGSCGQVKRLRCPYHAWTYSLEGGLIAAPMSDQIEGFNKFEIALPEFKIQTMNDEIFISLERI